MSLHPLLYLLIRRPQWLAEHAQAYGELFADEASAASSAWRWVAVLLAVAVGSGLIALTLAGVALMLWAVTPPAQLHAPWALWVAPLVPAGLGLVCAWAAQVHLGHPAFRELRQQLAADLALLQELGSP